jgi:hypothetical protein
MSEAQNLAAARIDTLDSLVKYLPAKDQDFAKSLVAQAKTKGGLSTKQWYWVDRLIAAATDTDKPAPQQVDLGTFKAVIELFDKAREHIKYPRIKLLVGQQPIALSVAGSSSKAPGTVNVTDGERFGQNVWFGRVTPQGVWQKGPTPSDAMDEVEHFLKKFGQDPAGTAKEYGKLTGRCCFCDLPLSDERSTSAGFGPTCAKNYGLTAEWKASQPVLATTQKQLELA